MKSVAKKQKELGLPVLGVPVPMEACNCSIKDDMKILTMFLNILSYGAATVSAQSGAGLPLKGVRIAVEKDILGMSSVKHVGTRVGIMAKIVKAGREVTGLV
jgi:hypothetical protein